MEESRREYNIARRLLRKEINKAKLKAWEELISTVNDDPWGLPYRLVLNKLRSGSLNIAELLKKELTEVLDALFPVTSRQTSGPLAGVTHVDGPSVDPAGGPVVNMGGLDSDPASGSVVVHGGGVLIRVNWRA